MKTQSLSVFCMIKSLFIEVTVSLKNCFNKSNLPTRYALVENSLGLQISGLIFECVRNPSFPYNLDYYCMYQSNPTQPNLTLT